ncbi:hypothetical protein [Actinomadura sp. B10D3]|uniref:hypothetical protein n=1 Tax=Actinomadura sp. B10D3 TaxID=3153557 RepID=UPI00325C73A9
MPEGAWREQRSFSHSVASPFPGVRPMPQRFKPTGDELGHLSPRKVPGSTAVYRLRLLSQSSYLTTASPAERDSLVAGGKFRYEGVPGFISTQAGAGKMAICRVSKGSFWKIIPTAQAGDFRSQGWTGCDGVGYTWTTA